jgi:hypothetical protein
LFFHNYLFGFIIEHSCIYNYILLNFYSNHILLTVLIVYVLKNKSRMHICCWKSTVFMNVTFDFFDFA